MIEEQALNGQIVKFLHDTTKTVLLITSEVKVDIKVNIPVFDGFIDNQLYSKNYRKFRLSSQNTKCIIVVPSALLHQRSDPALYFAPIINNKIQKKLLMHYRYFKQSGAFIVNVTPVVTNTAIPFSQMAKHRHHFLNQTLMVNDPIIMRMLAERAITSEAFKAFLFELVYDSRDDKEMQIAAANAITALNFAKVPFSGRDLSRVRIPFADLHNADLDGANFTDTNLDYINLSNANLNNTNLNGSSMEGVVFGEFASIDKTHDGFVTSVKYSPDGELLATASNDGKVGLWFVDKGLCKAILEEKMTVDHLAFSPKGSLISFTRGSRISIIYFKEDLDKRLTLNVKQDLVALAFAANEALVIAASEENVFKWYYKREHVTHLPIPDAERYRTFTLSEDGSLFAAGDRSGGITVFSTANMKKMRSISSPQTEITALSFNKFNTFIASGSNDNSIWVFPLTSSTSAKVLKGHTKYITALCFDPTNNYLISGSWDETIRLWNLSDNTTVMVYQNHSDPISSLSFHPEGSQFASGSKDRTVRRWNLKFNKDETAVNYIYGISMSPNRSLVATASDDFTIRLWHIRYPGISVLLKHHTNHINGLFFSANSQCLASVDIDHQVCLWNAKGNLLYSFTIQDDVRNIIFHQTNSNIIIIVHGDNCFSVFEKNKNMRKVTNNNAAAFAQMVNSECCVNDRSECRVLPTIIISLDRNYCAFTATNHSDIVLWDLKLNIQVAIAKGHFAVVMCLAFSPDGNYLASSGHDNTVRVWRMPDLKPVCCLTEHTDTVTALAWHPDSKILASSGHDEIICLWDIAKEECQAKLKGHQAVVRNIFFTNDGRVVSGGRSINIWQSFQIQSVTQWYRIWTSHPEFSSHHCNIDSVKKLSYNNLRLMKQSGATDNPIDEAASVAQGREVKKQLFEETLGNLQQNLSQIFQFMQANDTADDDSAALEAAKALSLEDPMLSTRKP